MKKVEGAKALSDVFRALVNKRKELTGHLWGYKTGKSHYGSDEVRDQKLRDLLREYHDLADARVEIVKCPDSGDIKVTMEGQ